MPSHITYAERISIQRYLAENISFKEIAQRIDKTPSCISREVRRFRTEVETGKPGYSYNPCRHRKICKRKNICSLDCIKPKLSKCALCSECHKHCDEYLEEVCASRFKPPYVCNGCPDLRNCTLTKNFYDAESAQYKSHDNLCMARSGLCTSEREIKRLNDIISPLIRKGQSIHQIYESHKDEIMCCEKTLYNYIDANLFDVTEKDMPRKSRLRPRKQRGEYKVDKGCRIGRSYRDLQRYLGEYPDISIVQMDTVIGSVGGKCLLTIHFVETSFMLAFIRDANTSHSVIEIFNNIQNKIGIDTFKEIFPLIVTDNGAEFSNPTAIECDSSTGEVRTKVFYCDASRPYQKGAIEVNHELIRRILTKVDGKNRSFDKLTQADIDLMMNHINSYKRKKLNNRSPYESFSFYHGQEVLDILGCVQVAADDITLRPELLKL